MSQMVITIQPVEARPGWFEARVISSLATMMGVSTVTGNSEITALRGLLTILLKRADEIERQDN